MTTKITWHRNVPTKAYHHWTPRARKIKKTARTHVLATGWAHSTTQYSEEQSSFRDSGTLASSFTYAVN